MIKAIRQEEMERAAGILGATIDCFDYGDGPLLLGPERRLEVMDAIRAFVLDVALCHWIDDFLLPDHVEAAQGVLWAARYCSTPASRPRTDTAHPPSTSATRPSPVTKVQPDFFVGIDSTMGCKIAAMKTLIAQLSLPTQYEVLAR